MMINRRLIGKVSESKKYIAANVIFQWVALLANIGMMVSLTEVLSGIYSKKFTVEKMYFCIFSFAISILMRFLCNLGASRMSFLSSKMVKKNLRDEIYRKLLALGSDYREKIATSEIVQVAVEGVDQLETYFGAYLPQFFYSMLAPVTLFVFLSFVNLLSALVLLLCVPLIPITIAAIQTWAKKLLAKYWGEYTTLGDTFLENLQGLTTLKIYGADEFKQEEMKEESERFRRITMKVLTMQLNSITIMDVIAYGGAALGVILAALQYLNGRVDLSGALLILLLAADFFLPMRLLGSYFHIAMNGMAASDKIFALLDLPEPRKKEKEFPFDGNFVIEDASFGYEEGKNVLHAVSMEILHGSYTAIAGQSGCGKSTLAKILTGQLKGYEGGICVGGIPLSEIREESLREHVIYIGHQAYLFVGTVRDNLRMGKTEATEEEMWEVLDRVNLSAFLRGEEGLDTRILEGGNNFSGGQRQRLALARALLADREVYILDEATSNIDMESEDVIMGEIRRLRGRKTLLVISHRLENVKDADRIYVMQDGRVVEEGRQEELLQKDQIYANLWKNQQDLENYGKEDAAG